MPRTHHKVWRRLFSFPRGRNGFQGNIVEVARLTLTCTLPCAARADGPGKLSNVPSTRGVFKQKFEQSDSRKENESQARKQCPGR
jgi:hypothetical protein